MKAFFVNEANEKKELVAEAETLRELNLLVNQKIEEKGFDVRYMRCWMTKEGMVEDFGSWSTFVLFEGVDVFDLMESANGT